MMDGERGGQWQLGRATSALIVVVFAALTYQLRSTASAQSASRQHSSQRQRPWFPPHPSRIVTIGGTVTGLANGQKFNLANLDVSGDHFTRDRHGENRVPAGKRFVLTAIAILDANNPTVATENSLQLYREDVKRRVQDLVVEKNFLRYGNSNKETKESSLAASSSHDRSLGVAFDSQSRILLKNNGAIGTDFRVTLFGYIQDM